VRKSTVIAEGIGWPEGLRWYENLLWFSDTYGTRKVHTINSAGTMTDIGYVQNAPGGLGWTPNGDLLVVSMEDTTLMQISREDTRAVVVSDLSPHATCLNDMVVDAKGNAYIGDIGFNFGLDDPVKGKIVLVTSDGDIRVVAEDLFLPNGLVISPDGEKLIVAETFGGRLSIFEIQETGSLGERKTFHSFDDDPPAMDMEILMSRPVMPDGICLNAEGGVWVANPLQPLITCVNRDGEVLDEVMTSQPSIACVLGGSDRKTLYVSTGDMSQQDGTSGKIESADVESSGV
jgi:sugar lactone lactonase YvrE